MSKKKKGFLFFICSLIPGAGEMYLGFFKQGVSIMALFWGAIGLSSWINFAIFIYFIPILWFYSFFRVHNLNSLPDEEFYAVEDKYIFDFDDKSIKKSLGGTMGKRVLAVGLIAVGFSMILTMLRNMVGNILEWFGLYEEMGWFLSFLYDIPQCVIAVLFIILGIHLIKGKKKELDSMDLDETKEKTAFSIGQKEE